MPFLSQAQRICPNCQIRPVKRNIRNGRNKGYLKTCGEISCLNLNRYSKETNMKKKFIPKEKLCEHCNELYISTCWNQRWCKICVPDHAARLIMYRYGLSHKQLTALQINNPICEICKIRKSTVVDHNHQNGNVRGYICDSCNLFLGLIEKPNLLHSALKYLEKNICVRS